MLFEVLSDNEKFYVILIWLVFFGGSCYYWGIDIDVYDRVVVYNWGGKFNFVESEYFFGGLCYVFLCWLVDNME